MLKRTFTYENYNGVEVTEAVYFNLNRSELVMWQSSEDGGLAERLQRILDSKDGKNIMKTFREVILKAYGEKSDDGRRFVKSPELSAAFEQTPMFDMLFSELLMSPETALDFVNKIMPPDLAKSLPVDKADSEKLDALKAALDANDANATT